ncbi:hypothetical protein NQZ68_002811 [Dissostichus eleginoides]|nr:hypothetical protein NQZ68_002811 [Dissostichus eleginoides]
MNRRFSERNSQLVEALCALDPENPHFLDVQKVTPLLELTKTTLVESKFAVARNFLQSEMARSTGDVDPHFHPAALLQASCCYANRAYRTETWSDFWGILGYM